MAAVTWPALTIGQLMVSVDNVYVGTMKRSLQWGICLYDNFQDEDKSDTYMYTIEEPNWEATFPGVKEMTQCHD